MIRAIDAAACISCGTCEEVCPMDVLRLDAEAGHAVIRYLEHCQTCYRCEQECLGGAIHVDPFTPPRPGAW
jgi:NAD-dependent dihydropyrimidine dehydrogenase PreA subunit